MKSKAGSLKRSSKFKSLPGLSKGKKKIHTTKITNRRGDTTDLTEINQYSQRKAQFQITSLMNATKHLMKNRNSSHILPKARRAGYTSQFILR